MNRKKALYLALLTAVSGTALASPPTEMGAAPVVGTPQASALGTAQLQSARLRGGIVPSRVVQLAAPTQAELSGLHARRVDQVKHGQPFQIGFTRMVAQPLVNLSKLDWKLAGDGSRVATFNVSSAQAAALRASLVLRGAGATPGDPSKVTLRFTGDDGQVFEQSGATFAANGKNAGWSPAVNGQNLLIELALPAGQYPENFSLSIPRLSHLDISPTASTREMMTIAAASTSCENNVVCRANPTTGFTNATKAVMRLIATNNIGTFTCTGTLLNNNNTPKRYLVWTAAHCINTQAVADTLQTSWFYETTSCNGSTVSPRATTVSGGAILRHFDLTRDTALLELKNAPPNGAFYGGWSSKAIAATGTPMEGIHHPLGGFKKYSLGTVTALNATSGDNKPMNGVVWSQGITEVGSSGSGLFTIAGDGSYQLRGGLLGGDSSCEAKTNPDYYSRFSDVYPLISTYFGK